MKKGTKTFLIILIVVFTLIFALLLTGYIIINNMYGKMYENRIPIVENTGEPYTPDVENPPNIIEDNITGPIEDITGEYVDVSDDTSVPGEQTSAATQTGS